MSAQPIFAPRSGGGEGSSLHVSPESVTAAIHLADYLAEHARAAYQQMGLDPAITNIPFLLGWLRRTGLTTFTRRDAIRAAGRRIRSPFEIDDALTELEHHNYIRPRPTRRRPGSGRNPGPAYDVHPSLAAG
jgi:hypothetical protein